MLLPVCFRGNIPIDPNALKPYSPGTTSVRAIVAVEVDEVMVGFVSI